MEDELIDESTIPLSRKSLLPGAGFFYPDSLDAQRADEETRQAVEGAEAVVIADSDADGLGCVALLREVYDAAIDATSVEESLLARLDGEEVVAREEDGEAAEEEHPESPVALVAAGPHTLDDALARVAEYLELGTDVYICDLSPDNYEDIEESIDDITARADQVRWFDHHQWHDDVAADVRDAGVDLVIGESDEECTVDVALRSLDYDFPDHLEALAEVTRDHDLWIKEDTRSDDLADYSRWSDPEEYIAIVGTYGPNLPDAVEEFIAQRRVEKTNLIERAVERADVQQVGPWTVGVTYGRCSQNEVAEALREEGADAAVIVKPAGSASIRGSDGFERCHEVAEQVNGGGHPKAAGCKPDIYDDMLDYAHHWSTQGSACKQVILSAFKRLAAEETEDDEGVETER